MDNINSHFEETSSNCYMAISKLTECDGLLIRGIDRMYPLSNTAPDEYRAIGHFSDSYQQFIFERVNPFEVWLDRALVGQCKFLDGFKGEIKLI